jgi:predicted  nucleic acid-binding Zn-ribbon protein
MAKKNEVTVEDKLRALYDLQLIDSRVDEIRNVRGELPLEVEDLENEIAGLEKRLENFNQEVSDFDFQTKEQKNNIEVAKEEFKKYEENLKNVRNNREYNSIVKEQEFQELEIQLAEKRIKEFSAKIELKQEAIGQLNEKLKERKNHLKAKKGELDEILKETEKEESLLAKKASEFQSKIETSLFDAYQKIRKNVKNGLAIVPVERGASGGSYFTIPPQIQMEIASRQKIITDEHSGRILVDPELAKEEQGKMESIFSSKK